MGGGCGGGGGGGGATGSAVPLLGAAASAFERFGSADATPEAIELISLLAIAVEEDCGDSDDEVVDVSGFGRVKGLCGTSLLAVDWVDDDAPSVLASPFCARWTRP